MSTSAPSSLSRRGHSVRGLANWILDYAKERGMGLSNMALNKLLYFAYEAVLIKDNVLLTNAKIEAWEHGPVFREVYQAFKEHGDRPINTRAAFFSAKTGLVEESKVELSIDEMATLEAALSPLIALSASRLRQLSHVENGPWYRVWWYDGHANPGMEITPDLIRVCSSTRHS